MSASNEFDPSAIYASADMENAATRVLVSPAKYVQGPGVLQSVGRYLRIHGVSRVAILASARGHGSQAGEVAESLNAAGMFPIASTFAGECSLAEIDARVATLEEEAVDMLVAVGGGKCVDAGKCIGHRLGVPVVIVPTLASNDAPCSALSVLYSDTGVMSGVEIFPHSPAMVVVDSQVVADAPERYLVAGLGDAMATWYEARVCQQHSFARTILGTRPTLAASALSEACADVLYADGLAACAAVRTGAVDAALERVVEANTLLSGVGFESGGLAGAHGYAQGFTVLAEVERNFLHGEMVGMGVLAQLMLERNADEARRVAEFFARVGLPVNLAQLGIDAQDNDKLEQVASGAISFAPFANLGVEISIATLTQAMRSADHVGRLVAEELGDQAYQKLQS